MQTSEKTKIKGFTLIEMLLYIVIISTALIGVFTFINVLIRTRVKTQAAIEVEQQGILIMEALTQDIRNASSVSELSSETLSLARADGASVSVILEDQKILRSATAGTHSLNSPKVSASDLLISNQAAAGPPSIQISFTLSHANPSHRPEYDYARTFITSATLRSPQENSTVFEPEGIHAD